MSSRVVMPKLTDTMEEGVVLSWKKREGDRVAAGDVLAEIETDKAVMDLEAFAPGILRRIVVGEGQTVRAGALIGIIGEADEDITPLLEGTEAPRDAGGPLKSPAAGAATPSIAEERKADAGVEAKSMELKASPRARALARESGVDLAGLSGTGPGGRIIEDDVRKAKAAVPSVGENVIEQPLSQMRKAIARTTVESKAPVPHFYVSMEIDMEEAELVRAQLRQARPVSPSITDMIIKACALALTRYPEVNASFGGEVIRRHRRIDIGLAVGLEDGLIAPVLRDCGTLSLFQISELAHRMVERAKKRELRPEDYTGATFGLSNLGMHGVTAFIAVIMPPQAAALAVGAIRDVPVVEKGAIHVGRRMSATLSCDHRVLDGVQAAKFLNELKRLLEHPLELVLREVQTEPLA